MAPIRTQWTRLIRFIAAETSRVHFGQPIDASQDVGRAAASGQAIRAREILGSPLDPASSVSDQLLTIVRCLGLNYKDHADEAQLKYPEYFSEVFLFLFYKPTSALIGPGAPIIIPTFAQPTKEHLPDYETELVIVIGRPAKNVSEADALDYVLGYTAANDVSFRKHQFAVSQWNFSKGFDNTNPFGPCIVAASQIPDPQTIPLTSTVNGKLLQDGNTRNQIFTVRQTVSYLSQGTTLEPGSIILTGTPVGVGYVRDPPVYLKQGDTVEVFVGNGVGTLVNPVQEENLTKL
ncbi:fumarylacetoacetate hydrolase [Flagelloscypha sp. PMI_526]|nr:fumarylacetoacetate hydrolase [Flagelloscypha sp. PMI_526]